MPKSRTSRFGSGVTVLELVASLVVLGVLFLIVRPSIPSNDSAALWTSAQSLATNLRRTQTLAMSQGKSICFQIKAPLINQYGVFETSIQSGVPQCTSTIMVDPFTKKNLVFSLEQDIGFQSSPAVTSTIFNSLGKSGATATYYLLTSKQYSSVKVDAVTGLVNVSSTTALLPVPTTP